MSIPNFFGVEEIGKMIGFDISPKTIELDLKVLPEKTERRKKLWGKEAVQEITARIGAQALSANMRNSKGDFTTPADKLADFEDSGL